MGVPADIKEKADATFLNGVIPEVICSNNMINTSTAIGAFYLNRQESSAIKSYKENPLVEHFFRILNRDRVSYHALTTFSDERLRRQIEELSEFISKLRPVNLTVQPTYDGSVLYSFTLDSANYYLEHFVDYKNTDLDEVVLTAFKAADMTVDYSGSLEGAYSHFVPKSRTLVQHQTTNINASDKVVMSVFHGNMIVDFPASLEDADSYFLPKSKTLVQQKTTKINASSVSRHAFT